MQDIRSLREYNPLVLPESWTSSTYVDCRLIINLTQRVTEQNIIKGTKLVLQTKGKKKGKQLAK